MQVVEAGFDYHAARAALLHFKGNIDDAIHYLMAPDGSVTSEWLEAVQKKVERQPELDVEDKDAVNMLSKVVDGDEDSYLDMELRDELEYVAMYLAKIGSVMQ